MVHRDRIATVSFQLPGGQTRLRQMILYVSQKCRDAKFFGAIKLNKIIWKADFDSYVSRRVPVTGREYRKQKFGPALREMLPLQNDMERDNAIRFEYNDFGDGIIEQRTIALVDPDLSLFSEADLDFVNRSIRHYWDKTGTESSDESHGVAWRTREIGEPMPYQSALLSDNRPPSVQWDRLRALIAKRELASD